MNWLDFLILALIAWLTLSAYLSGFIRETVGLGSVIVGVVLAGLLHDNLAANLDIVITDETAATVTAFLAILIAVAVLGWVIGFFLRTVATLLFLGWADHAAGAVFGFIKGVILIQAAVVIFLLQPTLGIDDAISDSTIGSFFMDTTPVVRALLPEEFDQALRDFSA